MKNVILSLIMIGVSLGAFAQDDAQNCKQSVLPFLPAFEGYYLSDYCKFSEFLSYDFAVARNSRSVHKEGVYRETWYKRKTNNTKRTSGLQILKQQSDAIKAAGGELAPDSDGDFFKINYQGKVFWILINANTYSEDQDNYGVISIEGENASQESGGLGSMAYVTSGQQGPQGLQGSAESAVAQSDQGMVGLPFAFTLPDSIGLNGITVNQETSGSLKAKQMGTTINQIDQKLKELDILLDKLNSDKEAMASMTQGDTQYLQEALRMIQDKMQMMTNITKKHHEEVMMIIQNMKH